MKNLYLIGIIIVFLAVASVAIADPWDQRLDVPAQRFVPLAGTAVLDNETGLLWERRPSTARPNWFAAHARCNNLQRLARKGWRLPTAAELMSLLGPGGPGFLPPTDSTFDLTGFISATPFWSTDIDRVVTGVSDFALAVPLATLPVQLGVRSFSQTENLFVWCVRGGQEEPLPEWDRRINGSARFTSALPRRSIVDNETVAVLDNETGLVWEREPETDTSTFDFAFDTCLNLVKGGRQGWRLPTVHELASLVFIPPPAPNLALPSGHPFRLGTADPGGNRFFWSRTDDIADIINNRPTINHWIVNFGTGNVALRPPLNHFWCVRGGRGINPQ
jgi:Protein of unknown function (DUF1566)